MALKLGTLEVDLDVSTEDLTKAEKKVSKSTKVMTDSFNKLGRRLAGLFAGQQLIAMIKTADQMRVLEGRIRRVTKTADGFDRAWQAINKSADEAGVSIDTSAKSFERFLLATEQMGATISQVAKFNDLLIKTGRISGSSTEELSNALTQLSQGFQGGVIRAEEWNSIIEQAPEILRVVSRGIEGVDGDVGKLRKVMLAGQLTSDKFFNSFLSGSQQIQEDFDKLPLSLEQGMQRISNQFTRLLQNMNDTLGMTEKITFALTFWAEAFDDTTNKTKDLNSELRDLFKEIKNLEEFKELAILDGDASVVKEIQAELDPLIARTKEAYAELSKLRGLGGNEDQLLEGVAVDDPKAIAAAKKAAKALAKQKADAQEFLDELVFRTKSAAEQIESTWNTESEMFEKLAKEKLITDIELKEAQKLLNNEYLDAVEQMEKDAADKRNARNQAQADSMAQMATAISTSLANIATDGDSTLSKVARGFGDFAKSIIATSQAMAAATTLADPKLGAVEKLAALATIMSTFATFTSIAGGRVNGGGMQEGSMYAINEGGKSEILQEGGKQFLLAGKNASVIGNGAMNEASGGGGGGMSVNITNNISGTGEELDKKLQATMNASVGKMQSMYIQQMTQKTGKMFSATNQNYGKGRTTGRPM